MKIVEINHQQKVLLTVGSGVALLRIAPGKKKAFIEDYKPSSEYCKHMRGLAKQMKALMYRKTVQYPEIQLPTNGEKAIQYAVSNIMNTIFKNYKRCLSQKHQYETYEQLHSQAQRLYQQYPDRINGRLLPCPAIKNVLVDME